MDISWDNFVRAGSDVNIVETYSDETIRVSNETIQVSDETIRVKLRDAIRRKRDTEMTDTSSRFFVFFFVHNSRLKGIQERENILSLLQMLNLAFAEEIFGLKMPWQLEQTTMVAQDSMLKQTKK